VGAVLSAPALANATPVINLGTPENYCVVSCYIRVPFTIANYESTRKMGMVFCDLEAEVDSRLPVYNGETRTKTMQASPVGVFKNTNGIFNGAAELDTGISKHYFVGARLKSARCHL
jgi:hypothetical protein